MCVCLVQGCGVDSQCVCVLIVSVCVLIVSVCVLIESACCTWGVVLIVSVCVLQGFAAAVEAVGGARV